MTWRSTAKGRDAVREGDVARLLRAGACYTFGDTHDALEMSIGATTVLLRGLAHSGGRSHADRLWEAEGWDLPVRGVGATPEGALRGMAANLRMEASALREMADRMDALAIATDAAVVAMAGEP